MNINNPIAINYLQVKNAKNAPSIYLNGEYLFHTGFLPEQMLKVEVYKNKIVITPSIMK